MNKYKNKKEIRTLVNYLINYFKSINPSKLIIKIKKINKIIKIFNLKKRKFNLIKKFSLKY